MTAPSTEERSEALLERLFLATIGTLDLFSVHLGRTLGIYSFLADGVERTSSDVASELGLDERWVREWLEQQAVTGLLEVGDPAADAADRRFHLASDHAAVLAEEDSPAYVAPFAPMLVGIAQALDHVVAAAQSGDGVPYPLYGATFRDGQGAINRPAFQTDLVESWIPALPDVHERLVAGGRVCDVGCGLGWSTQAVARTYPRSRVIGIDVDAASVADAAALLPDELANRVSFVSVDGGSAADHGPFDLVLVLEALHDMGDPASVLSSIRGALADGGAVLVADERVAEAFIAPGDDVERMMYGWSVTHCLPVAMSDHGPEAIGTAIRPDTVRRLASEAGFARCEILPVDNDLFRFYRLDGQG